MAWFSSNISLGNIADLAGGAVNKLQESVKSIEKNFDTALGFEEREKADSSSEGTSHSYSKMSLCMYIYRTEFLQRCFPRK